MSIRFIYRWLIFSGIILARVVSVGMASSFPDQVVKSDTAPTATPDRVMQPPTGGLIIPELPSTATQADYGWQAYRLVCSACHAADGSGLTPEWIATWNPDDQNCWQSKCHALNHPSDGFELPHYIPPIVGPGELDAYRTAQDLYTYLRAAMPWQDPGYLTDQEYWNISVYLIQANGFTLPEEPLGQANAAAFVIDPSEAAPAVETTAPTLTAAPQPDPVVANSRVITIVGIILAVSAVLAGLFVYLTGRKRG